MIAVRREEIRAEGGTVHAAGQVGEPLDGPPPRITAWSARRSGRSPTWPTAGRLPAKDHSVVGAFADPSVRPASRS